MINQPLPSSALLDVDIAPVETVLFHSGLVCVADHNSTPQHPCFAGSDQIRVPCIGFPRRQSEIFAEGHAPFIADPTCAVFFDRGTVYRRRAIDPLGIRTTVVSLRPDLLPQLLQEHGVEQDDACVFRDVSARVEPAIHEESVALATRLGSGAAYDALGAEEACLGLVARTLAGAHAVWSVQAPSRPVAASQSDMVRFIKQHIRENIGQKMSLSDLAALIGVSPYYLCRFFRATTGQTVYQYQLQIRLAAALELLPEYQGNLAALAMDLGFSSHSHLATLFKRAYGFSPGGARQHRRAHGMRDNNLKAHASFDAYPRRRIR